ncbi:MAG: hypothetical protein K8E66_07555, partial [Phycisphaerales bacterium]|nr:hypothetical protein [Phycisphaerales bacterium]
MRTSRTRSLCVFLATVLTAAPFAAAQTLIGTEITYQGTLVLDGQPLNDTADFMFTLWDDPTGGLMIGSAALLDGVAVEDGAFTALVDFGDAAFSDEARW